MTQQGDQDDFNDSNSRQSILRNENLYLHFVLCENYKLKIS